MAVIVKRVSGELEQLRLQANADRAAERAGLERTLWGNPGGDVAGWRDALARAAAVEDAGQCIALYDRARRSGDDQLAKACLLEGRSRGMLGGFSLDGHDVPPAWGEAISALDDFDRNYGSAMSRMGLDMLMSPPQPAELAGINAYALANLAAATEAG